jgi:hypothetical protein
MPCGDLLFVAVASPAAPGAATISLTEALLLLSFAGLLVAAYQLNRVVQRLDALERRLPVSRAPSDPGGTPRPVSPAEGQLPPQIVAAITAACSLELGDSARIVSITSEAGQKQVWSLEGRRQIFASHQVR